jgi:hypothetical protein
MRVCDPRIYSRSFPSLPSYPEEISSHSLIKICIDENVNMHAGAFTILDGMDYKDQYNHARL